MKAQTQSVLRFSIAVALTAVILFSFTGFFVHGHASLAVCMIVAPFALLELLALSSFSPKPPERDPLFPRRPFLPSQFQRPPPSIA